MIRTVRQTQKTRKLLDAEFYLRANPDVAVSIAGQENPYENLIVQGKVVELTNEGADDDIDALAKRYLDADSYPLRQPGEERVIVKIAPEKVHHMNP